MICKAFLLVIVLDLLGRSQCFMGKKSMRPEKKFMERSLRKSRLGCEEFKCSSDGTAVCARLDHSSARRKKTEDLVYVQLVNMCEFDYMKCYKEIKTTLVPMEYCQHGILKEPAKSGNNVTVKKNNLTAAKSRKKRSEPSYGLDTLKREEISFEDIAFLNNREEDEEDEDEDEDDNHDDDDDDEDGVMVLAGEMKRENETEEATTAEPVNCPETCPRGNGMVCARCKHGVYKTFSSSCHAKTFLCKNQHEDLELVYRGACSLSGPYLQHKVTFTDEHAKQRYVDDHIVKHIICTSRGYIAKKGENAPANDRLNDDSFCADYIEENRNKE